MTITTAPPDRLAHEPKLLAHHLDELRASGLRDKTIAEAGLHSEDRPDQLGKLLNWTSKVRRSMGAALVFPFRDLDGEHAYSRLKFDHPRSQDGKPVRYESPRGQSSRPYFPPGIPDRLKQSGGDLLITEGEKKALAAAQAGHCCVGLVGVFGWKKKAQERLIPELERISWSKRCVFIVFDSDVAHNEQVQAAERRLAHLLKEQGARVRLVRLPAGPTGEKVGLDDLLVAQGGSTLEELLEAAVEPAPVTRTRASALDPADEAEQILAALRKEGSPALHWRGCFWRWQRGRWLETHADETQALVIKALNRRCCALTTGVIGNVLVQLKAQSAIPNGTEAPAWLGGTQPWPADETLATPNSVISLSHLVADGDFIRPATPDLFVTSALDFEFDPEAPAPTMWLQFLGQLWGQDSASIAALQELYGLCLTPDTRQQRIFMFIGPKRSGKGTLMRVLRGLVGEANCAGPTLAGLATNFGLWPLLNKSVAIFNDARLSGRADQAVVVERLLSISGEDALTVDRKHLAPVTAKIPARLVVVSNELPHLSDSSGALASRMLLWQLRETFFGREDRELTARLMTELPGILLWAIEGWRRLRERGRFVQPSAAEGLLGDLEELSSPIGAFIRERCVIGPDHRVAIETLFSAWKSWCEAKGRMEPRAQQFFGRDLRAAVPTLRIVQPREGDHRFRAYAGIGLHPHQAREGTRSL